MAEPHSFEGLDAFVAARGDALLATAVLLMGGRRAGEDLLQEALEHIMRGWWRVSGDPSGTCAGLCTTWPWIMAPPPWHRVDINRA